MTRSAKYVALGVPQATTVASVREPGGRVSARSVVPTEARALSECFHGGAERAALRELTRAYTNLVEDTTGVMLRLKALFRARAIATTGRRVYGRRGRAAWLAQSPDRGARFRAEALYAELDVLLELRPKAKGAMLAEARRDPAWAVLRTIPFLGPVRVALLQAAMKSPWRFRTKRNLWAYAGLAVVTQSTADFEIRDGRPGEADGASRIAASRRGGAGPGRLTTTPGSRTTVRGTVSREAIARPRSRAEARK
jgi:hypothetical protein